MHTWMSCTQVDKMLKLREEINAATASGKEGAGSKISVNDFVVKAAALALKKVRVWECASVPVSGGGEEGKGGVGGGC